MPIRLWPPARSISSRSSSNERPSVLPAPAVFSSSSRHASDSDERVLHHLADARQRLLVRLAHGRAGVEHHAVGPDLVAHPQRVDQRVRGLLAHLPVLRGRVDQVDRVDRDRLVSGLAFRCDRNSATSSGFQRVGRHWRGDWLNTCIASQPRSTARSCASTRPPAVDTCAPTSIAADEGSIRAFSNRRAAHRRREDGTVQLAPRARLGRPVRAAHRGHRPRALDAGERGPDPRRAALARARLGRGAALPVGAARAAHRGRGAAARVRARVRGRGRRPLPRARRGRDHLPRRDPRRRDEPALGDPGLRDPALRRQPALQPRGRGGRPRHGHHPRRARPGPRVEHAAPADDPARARRGAAAVRAHPAAPRARRQEALEAPRRGVGPGGARVRLPARGGPQLHRAARLGL